MEQPDSTLTNRTPSSANADEQKPLTVETDRSQRSDREGPTSADESNTEDATAGANRCGTCETTIGPREYRLSRIVEEGPVTHEFHYCSESCFPDDGWKTTRDGKTGPNSNAASDSNSNADARSTASRSTPRDWSYCR